MTNVTFKISSALKTIIGKELITDDFIAVFELVKNSFDANASEVKIIFEDLKFDTPRIIIQDNGVGMGEDDILNKWLFLAYSAKKSGEDYRDQIKTNRVIAGYKGIGRFSCDRLGAKLRLITRKSHRDVWSILNVDWNRFELDAQSEFQNIPAELSSEKSTEYVEIDHGTILEISELRNSDWNRDKLLKLRRSLERLINPHQVGDSEPFSVILSVLEERREDQKIEKEKPDEPWQIVNGPIRNFLFETLDLKTTQIQLEIDKDGETLITKLNDRGTLVYELLEKNPYRGILKDIRINLFFLNRAAKLAFSKLMGLRPVQYGSVFLYKNGFRVHPFGDYGDDSLGIDRRKQQGLYRFLGSRDLSGRIEIIQQAEKDPDLAFTESSSRNEGLIRNRAWDGLKTLFINHALMRLEKYVVDLAKFGAKELGMKGDFPELSDPNTSRQRELAFDLVVKLTQSNDVIDLRYDPNVLNILESQSADSVETHLGNLKRIVAQQNRPELYEEITRAESQAEFLRKAKEEAEAEAADLRAEVAGQETRISEQGEKIEKLLADTETYRAQTLFLQQVVSLDLEQLTLYHHEIKLQSHILDNHLGMILHEVQKLPDNKKTLDDLESASFANKIIASIAQYATKANFKAGTNKELTDVPAYIEQYVLRVAKVFNPSDLNIQVLNSVSELFEMDVSRIELSILVDNLISNSSKALAKNLTIQILKISENSIRITFVDDGKGLDKKLPSIEAMFEIGISTTIGGSGLGLYHVKNIVGRLNGKIEALPRIPKGMEIRIEVKR